MPNKTIKYRFVRGGRHANCEAVFDNRIWACGGMVDTLVLGTSAKAWEFESLHAQLLKKPLIISGFYFIERSK